MDKGSGATALLTALGPMPLRAAADHPPLDLYLQEAELSNARLSPDGQRLLALRSIEGRHNLVLINLEGREAKFLTSFKQADVFDARWLNNERILFRIEARAEDLFRRGGLWAINADGSQLVEPSGEMARAAFFSYSKLASQGQCIVRLWEKNGKHAGLRILDTFTGALTRMSLGAPGDVSEWALDAEDRPRAAVTREGEDFSLWIRRQPATDWEVVRR